MTYAHSADVLPRSLNPVTFVIMGKSRKNQRHIKIGGELKAALVKRKNDTRLDETAQILSAIEAYLKRPVSDEDRRLLRPKQETSEKVMPVEQEVWDKLHDRKDRFGFDLNEQVHIALTLYFAELNGVDPFTNEPLKKESPVVSVIGDELKRLGFKTGRELLEGTNQVAHNPLLMAAQIIINNAAAEAGNSIPLWQLSSVPCGPWKGIPEDAQPFEMTKQMADMVGAKAGDLLVPTEGESMLEAGIPDKGSVIMRLMNGRRPEIGEIVLCIIEREGDVWQSTIKHWFGFSRGRVVLKNGRTENVPLPPDVIEIQPIATLVGVIGRATFGTAKGLSTEAHKRRQSRGEDHDPLSE